MSSNQAISHPSRPMHLHAALRQFEDAVNDPSRDLPKATRQAELFVDALRAVPAWYEELERRATLVERLCGPGSRYELAKHCSYHFWHQWRAARRFWRPYQPEGVFDQVLVPFWGPLADKGNGEWEGTPHWLSQIELEHEAIDRVFEAYDSSLPLKTRKTLSIWRKACRMTERQASWLDVDGARWLWKVHRAEKANRKKDAAPAMRYLAQHDKTSSSLDSMLQAARSLVEWIEASDEYERSDKLNNKFDLEGRTGATKHKRSTTKGEARAKLIAAITLHHNYDNGSVLNTEPIGVKALAKEAGVAPASASRFFAKEFKGHKKYDAMCSDPSTLVGALRLLRGEMSPHVMLGNAGGALADE
jgi:hypothetical protein